MRKETDPGPRPGAPPRVALHDQLDGRWRWGWAYAGVWLFFLVPSLLDAVHERDHLRGAAGVLVILVFSILYLHTWSTLRIRGAVASRRRRRALLGATAGLTLVEVLLVGQPALAMTPFVTVLAMVLLSPVLRLTVTAVIIALTAAATEAVPHWNRDLGLVLGLLLTAFVMWGMTQMIERTHELATAHARLAELAVADERARFARDLHDLLGHSLTLMAIKAELAGRLVRLDVDRAEREISEVERLARDALVDVRAAVGGYRQASLSGELISARAVLDAAGIEAELPSAIDDVAGHRRELLGWAVREGITNVVRHSHATRCRILVGPDGIEIVDDGRGAAPLAGAGGGLLAAGSGLAGLRERAEAAGASVVVSCPPDGGFRLRVGW